MMNTEHLGIKLLTPYTRAKDKHLVQCLTCQHEWHTTPVFISRTNKVNGTNGCPQCNIARSSDRKAISRAKNKQILADKGLTIHTDWSGQRVHDRSNTNIYLKVTQVKCGHTFTSTTINLLSTPMTCTVCGIEQRTRNINNWSKQNSVEWQKTADIWKKYRANVTRHTRATYKKHKHQINPMGLPFGRCGEEGKYQLDHVVPVRWCFEHYVPVEMVASLDNLQILDWHTNVSSRDHLKGELPEKFRLYADK